MNPVVILPAAGLQVRWAFYRGVPKQMVKTYDEPMIHRTQRLLFKNNNILDTVVLANDKSMVSQYGVFHQPGKPSRLPGTAIGHSVECWIANRDIYILLGDVIWEEQFLKEIVEREYEEITFIGHQEGGVNKNPEIFAVMVPFWEQQRMLDAIDWVKDREEPRISGGWQVYRRLHGIMPREHRIAGGWMEAPPEITDIDFPEEYEAWRAEQRKRRRANAKSVL